MEWCSLASPSPLPTDDYQASHLYCFCRGDDVWWVAFGTHICMIHWSRPAALYGQLSFIAVSCQLTLTCHHWEFVTLGKRKVGQGSSVLPWCNVPYIIRGEYWWVLSLLIHSGLSLTHNGCLCCCPLINDHQATWLYHRCGGNVCSAAQGSLCLCCWIIIMVSSAAHSVTTRLSSWASGRWCRVLWGQSSRL